MPKSISYIICSSENSMKSLEKFLERFYVQSESYKQTAIKVVNNLKKLYPDLETTITELKNEEEVYDFINHWIAWCKKVGTLPQTITTYFGIVNQLLYYFDHKLTNSHPTRN